MRKSELQRILNSISSLQDRLISIEEKFDDDTDYAFNSSFETSNTLRGLLSVASAALNEIYSACDFNSSECLLVNYD